MVPKEVLKTLKERMNHPVFGYTRWNHHELKEAIKQWYQSRFDTLLEEEWTTYTPTVIYAVSTLIQMLTKKGKECFYKRQLMMLF